MIVGVIPGNSNPVPEGGNSPSVGGVGWMQDVTEQGVKDRAYNQVFPSMQGAKNSLFGNFIGGIFSGFLSIFRGGSGPSWLPSGVREVAEEIRDGQLDLNERQDTLDMLMNRASAYPSYSHAVGAGTWYRVPFDKQIGPARGAEIYPGGIRLQRGGHWDVYAQLYTASTAGLLTRSIDWEVRVYTGAGSARKIYAKQVGRMNGNPSQQATIVTDFGFDAPGAEIEVWVNVRNWNGPNIAWGPAYCRLTTKQVSSERIGADGSEDSGIPTVE